MQKADKMIHKVFRIRNRNTGLFSTGGMSPNFTANGKTWTKKHYVYAHIKELVGRDPADIYNDCDIVEAEITELLVPIEPANRRLIEKTEEAIAYQKANMERPENSMTHYYSRAYHEYIGRRSLMK